MTKLNTHERDLLDLVERKRDALGADAFRNWALAFMRPEKGGDAKRTSAAFKREVRALIDTESRS